MKSATIPPVRVEPELRDAMQRALEEGETLTALVETAVRREVQRRQAQAEFVSRGLAAIERSRAQGDGVPAEAVIAKLQARLDQATRDRRS